eukprot:5204948-Pleurochrysis_carterae.AAC.1
MHSGNKLLLNYSIHNSWTLPAQFGYTAFTDHEYGTKSRSGRGDGPTCYYTCGTGTARPPRLHNSWTSSLEIQPPRDGGFLHSCRLHC